MYLYIDGIQSVLEYSNVIVAPITIPEFVIGHRRLADVLTAVSCMQARGGGVVVNLSSRRRLITCVSGAHFTWRVDVGMVSRIQI